MGKSQSDQITRGGERGRSRDRGKYARGMSGDCQPSVGRDRLLGTTYVGGSHAGGADVSLFPGAFKSSKNGCR